MTPEQQQRAVEWDATQPPPGWPKVDLRTEPKDVAHRVGENSKFFFYVANNQRNQKDEQLRQARLLRWLIGMVVAVLCLTAPAFLIIVITMMMP